MEVMMPTFMFFGLMFGIGIGLFFVIATFRKWKEEAYIRELLIEFLEKHLGIEE